MDLEGNTVTTRSRSTIREEIEERKTGGGPSPRRILRKRSLYAEHSEESSSEEGSIGSNISNNSDNSDSERCCSEGIRKKLKKINNLIDSNTDYIKKQVKYLSNIAEYKEGKSLLLECELEDIKKEAASNRRELDRQLEINSALKVQHQSLQSHQSCP